MAIFKRSRNLDGEDDLEDAAERGDVGHVRRGEEARHQRGDDADAATLEAIGVAPDYTLRAQSVTVSDK